MKKRVMPKEARRILSKVRSSNSFWLCTNAELRSLSELSSALEGIDDDVFRYHVNRDKNDFEAWIRDIVQDKELAREIARVKTKETLLRKICERTEHLKKIAKRVKAKPKKKAKKARKRTAAAKRRKVRRAKKRKASKKAGKAAKRKQAKKPLKRRKVPKRRAKRRKPSRKKARKS